VVLANGARLHGMSSNPKGFRSKGGKVVLDEYAWHDHAEALWKAAQPSIMWGHPIRVLSTHHGLTCRYYRIVKEARENLGRPWSLHHTSLEEAVAQGLADKVVGRPLSEAERAAWVEEVHDGCLDEETWLEEYCCVPQDGTTAFLTYELIATCEEEAAGDPDGFTGGVTYIGLDIGRTSDLTVVTVLERVGDVLWVREKRELAKTAFRVQREVLDLLIVRYRPRRVCIDATGLGMQLAEEAQDRYGAATVERVTFTAGSKEEMAFQTRTRFEDRTVRVPPERALREDLHAVKKVTTAAGNLRFDAARTEAGHADRFWSLALAVHAATSPVEVFIGAVPDFGGRA